MRKPAARIGDMHSCPLVAPNPHGGGPVITGSPNVFIGGKPAATIGDTCTCVGPTDIIVQGSSSVFINGKPAARIGDMTAHGGRIVQGEVTVLIGDASGGQAGLSSPFALHTGATAPALIKQLEVLTKAAQNGTPLAELC